MYICFGRIGQLGVSSDREQPVNRNQRQADHAGIAAGHRTHQPPAQALDAIGTRLIHRLAGCDIGVDLRIGQLGDHDIAGNQIELGIRY